MTVHRFDPNLGSGKPTTYTLKSILRRDGGNDSRSRDPLGPSRERQIVLLSNLFRICKKLHFFILLTFSVSLFTSDFSPSPTRLHF